MNLLYVPFILQGIVMFVDEFYFHEKRGLPRWEKFGHPLDTLTVFACYSYLIWGSAELYSYVSLCAISCLFITKDEFVHVGKCPPAEQWLHSLLFVLHPISFLSAYLLVLEGELSFLKIQSLVVIIFMFYQTLRWSFPWRTQPK